MKLFISWSGELSEKVALSLREWLPQVLNVLEPYVSSKDIQAGEQWFANVRRELESSGYGLICLTKENLRQPWLLFEAGALSTSMSRSRVVPFLIDVSPSDLFAPLSEFQAIGHKKDDILDLLLSLHKDLEVTHLSEMQLKRSFEVWWPELERSINNSIHYLSERGKTTQNSSSDDNEGKDRAILEEILNNSRILMQRTEDQLINDNKTVDLNSLNQNSSEKSNESKTALSAGYLRKNYGSIERQAVSELKRGESSEKVYNELVKKGVPKSEASALVTENIKP